MSLDLLRWLREPGEDRAVHFAGPGAEWDRWSHARLAAEARRAAGGLGTHGVEAGDRVLIVEPSGPAFIALFYGALLLGATPCPAAPPMTMQDQTGYAAHLRTLLRAAAPRVLATDDRLAPQLSALAAGSGVTVVADSELRAAPASEGQAHEGQASERQVGLPELALVQFTSGSSGPAKAVRISRASLTANVTAIARWLDQGRDDGTASWLPVHHDMGLIGCLLTPLAVGGDLWLLRPEDFLRAPLRYLRCFADGRARLSAMPTFGLHHVVRRVTPAQVSGLDLSGWRTLIVGAERVDTGVLRQFESLLGPAGFTGSALAPAYGLAEATLAVTGPRTRRWSSAEPVGDEGVAVVGCGTPVLDATVAVVDSDLNPLPDGVAGEIVVGGPSVASGYLDAAELAGRGTRFVDGRLLTGDAGFLRHGELFVLGRLGDSLKVRGREVFAEELEALLDRHGIPARRVAALLGTDRGTPTAVIVVEAEATDTLVRQIRQRLTSRLDGVRLVVHPARAGTIARTTSGKPRRRLLWQRWVSGELTADPTRAR